MESDAVRDDEKVVDPVVNVSVRVTLGSLVLLGVSVWEPLLD